MAVLPARSSAERKCCSESSPCRPCAERRWSQRCGPHWCDTRSRTSRHSHRLHSRHQYGSHSWWPLCHGLHHRRIGTTRENAGLGNAPVRQIAPQAALARTARTQGTLHPEYPPFTKCQTQNGWFCARTQFGQYVGPAHSGLSR